MLIIIIRIYSYLDEDLDLCWPGGEVLVDEDDPLKVLHGPSLALHVQLPLGQEQGQVPVVRALLEEPRHLALWLEFVSWQIG